MGDELLDDNLFEEKRKPNGRVMRIFLVLQMLGSILAILIAWYEIESIVGSGPTMSIIGLCTLLASRSIKNKRGAWIGISPLLISIFWYIIIENFNWSPGDAYWPVNTFLTIATIITIRLGINAYLNSK